MAKHTSIVGKAWQVQNIGKIKTTKISKTFSISSMKLDWTWVKKLPIPIFNKKKNSKCKSESKNVPTKTVLGRRL